jgi:hypothetical protein
MNPTRRTIGAVVYLASMLLVVEIVLQGFYYVTAGDFLFRRTGLPIYAANEYSGIANRPGLELEHHTQEFTAHYFNNAVGLRVPRPGLEYPIVKPPDTFRVVLLGASFAYGWAVDYEQTVAGLLAQQLEAGGFAGGKRVELINAGVPSLNPAPQLRWYEHVGRDYSPDLVLQFIYGTMAVPNDPTTSATVSDDGYLVPKGVTFQDSVRARAKMSATVFYAWTVWTALQAKWGAEAPAQHRVLGAGREMSTQLEFDPKIPDVAAALALYGDLQRVVRDSGSRLVIAYFPLSYAVHPEDYYWLDIHWTPKGNAVAARALADYLLADPAIGLASSPEPASSPAATREPDADSPRSGPPGRGT